MSIIHFLTRSTVNNTLFDAIIGSKSARKDSDAPRRSRAPARGSRTRSPSAPRREHHHPCTAFHVSLRWSCNAERRENLAVLASMLDPLCLTTPGAVKKRNTDPNPKRTENSAWRAVALATGLVAHARGQGSPLLARASSSRHCRAYSGPAEKTNGAAALITTSPRGSARCEL